MTQAEAIQVVILAKHRWHEVAKHHGIEPCNCFAFEFEADMIKEFNLKHTEKKDKFDYEYLVE